MATKPKIVPKISVKIWTPVLEKLDRKMAAACLRRDAYLAEVLKVEINELDSEISNANSESSYKYVAGRLDRLERKPLSLALPLALTQQLNEICARKRIVRDAFFNRVLLLLAAAPNVVDALLFGDSDWRGEVWSEHRNDGPFFQNGFYPLEPQIDPFWAIRRGLELREAKEATTDLAGAAVPANLYTTVFEVKVRGDDLLGLSCYLPDWRVPGHPAEKERTAKLDELFEQMAAVI